MILWKREKKWDGTSPLIFFLPFLGSTLSPKEKYRSYSEKTLCYYNLLHLEIIWFVDLELTLTRACMHLNVIFACFLTLCPLTSAGSFTSPFNALGARFACWLGKETHIHKFKDSKISSLNFPFIQEDSQYLCIILFTTFLHSELFTDSYLVK